MPRGVILAFVIIAVATMFVPPCLAQKPGEEDKKGQDIWSEGQEKGPGRGPPGLEPPPEGEQRGPRRGPPRFELTDQEFDQIIKSLKQRDPTKAKELAELRGKDPDQFNTKLREYAGEELGKIAKGRMETWRARIQAEFIEWLGKNYRSEAEKLAVLKDKEPELYWKEFDRLREKYWRIFEEERRNPELAAVLKEDLELKERADALVRRIKAAESETVKKELTARLQDILSRRYDLIVRRKQIAYERLLKWLEELKNRVEESKDEIKDMKNEQIKAENVRKHVKDLLEGTPAFHWD
jgi:hypothetical protein